MLKKADILSSLKIDPNNSNCAGLLKSIVVLFKIKFVSKIITKRIMLPKNMLEIIPKLDMLLLNNNLTIIR